MQPISLLTGLAGLKGFAGLAASALWLSLGLLLQVPSHAAPSITDVPTAAAAQAARQVLAAADTAGRPFAIVDKQAARLVVFHADGRLAGSSAVLLGRDLGDDSVPGVGERTQAGTLRPGDATTPAGRFASRPGHNRAGEDIVWLDYGAALAIHRVRPGASLANRLHRLATPSPVDNRVTAGCVVVPVAFYNRVVMPLLGRQPAVVVVLPEAGDTPAL